MSQHDMVLDNAKGFDFRTDLNNALAALVSQNAGATAPTATFANMIWYDSANSKVMMRNEADDAWITLFELDQSGNIATASVPGGFGASAYQAVTITSGTATYSGTDRRRAFVLQAESSTADALHHINVGAFNNGDVIIITPDGGDTITCYHGTAGSGRLILSANKNVVLNDNYNEGLILMLVGSDWYELGRFGIEEPVPYRYQYDHSDLTTPTSTQFDSTYLDSGDISRIDSTFDYFTVNRDGTYLVLGLGQFQGLGGGGDSLGVEIWIHTGSGWVRIAPYADRPVAGIGIPDSTLIPLPAIGLLSLSAGDHISVRYITVWQTPVLQSTQCIILRVGP